MCLKPFRQGVAEFGCGQCLPCRLNRRRVWTARLMLESYLHEASVFLTLTYDPEHHPADGSVSPRHLQLFMKKLRERVDGKLRFFGVGEYGDLNHRPHYHLVVFGLSVADHEYARPDLCECVVCASWAQGCCHVGEVTVQSAAYTVGYVTKSVMHPSVAGKHPEFARMSLRPGIGAGAASVIGKAVLDDKTGELRLVDGSVPTAVRQEMRMWPVGRYLRHQIGNAVGVETRGYSAGYVQRLSALAEELSAPGGREKREEFRLQVGRKAEALESIARSKKGKGI